MTKFLDDSIHNIVKVNIWSNVYGLSRSIVALGTLLTFLFNDMSTLFRPVLGVTNVPICDGLAGNLSLFCFLSNDLVVAKGLVIGVLFLVIIGIYPRITGVLHWWVNLSFISSSPLVDGGEHVAAILSFLMVPLTLCDDRRWHWANRHGTPQTTLSQVKQLIGFSAYQMIRLQIAIIYLHAAVAKCAVNEWTDGTALYYWFNDEVFGLGNWLRPLVEPLIFNSFTLTFLTWSIIILEFSLFASLFMKHQYRKIILVWGLTFHLGIALVHGLVSFALIMIGALIIFLVPINSQIEIRVGPLRKAFSWRDILLARIK
jgi:antimicrobial peptide system SdpB family protein